MDMASSIVSALSSVNGALSGSPWPRWSWKEVKEGAKETLYTTVKYSPLALLLGLGGCSSSPGNNNSGVRDATTDSGDTGPVQGDADTGTPDGDASTSTCSDYYGTQSVRQGIGVVDHFVKAPAHDPAGFSMHNGYLNWVNQNYDLNGTSPIQDNKVVRLDLDEQSSEYLQMQDVAQVDTNYSIAQELSKIFPRSITAFNFQPQAGAPRDVVAVGVKAEGVNTPSFEAAGLFLYDGTTQDFKRLAYNEMIGTEETYLLKNVNTVFFAGGMVCATHDLDDPVAQTQSVPCKKVIEGELGNASFDSIEHVTVLTNGKNTAGVAKIDETTVAVVRRGVANDQNNRPRIVFWDTTNANSGFISLTQGADIEISATHVPIGWTLVNLQRLAMGKTAQYFAVAATNGSSQKIVLINSTTDQQTSIDITDKTTGQVSGIVIDEDNHRLYVTEEGNEANGTSGNLIVIDFHQDTGLMSYAAKSPSTSGDAGVAEQPFEGALKVGTGLRLGGVDHDKREFYLFYMKSYLAGKPAECRNGGIPIPVDDESGFTKVDMSTFQMSIPSS